MKFPYFCISFDVSDFKLISKTYEKMYVLGQKKKYKLVGRFITTSGTSELDL